MRTLIALLAVLCASPRVAAAQGSTATAEAKPPLQLELSPENAGGAWTPSLYHNHEFDLGVSLRFGALAVANDFAYPYSILMPSPYASGGLKAVYHGAFEAAGFGNIGMLDLRSQKAFSDPTGSAASPANGSAKQSQFQQQESFSSLYGDLGKVVSLGSRVKGAFFAGYDQWSFGAIGGGDGSGTGLAEQNAGTAWMYFDGANRVTLFGDVRGETARVAFYRNEHADWELVPATLGGAEYARKLSASDEVRAGVEGQSQRADTGLRPYLGWNHAGVDTLVAGDFRRSNNEFYPDTQGIGARVAVPVNDALSVTGTAVYDRYNYPMAPGPQGEGSVRFGISWDLDHKAVVQSAVAFRRAQVERAYAVADSQKMNSGLRTSAYAAQFATLIQNSPTYADFVRNVHASGSEGILQAVSMLSLSLGVYNYNHDEAGNPNLESVEAIYQRGRGSYLSQQNDPILVCMGEAQFTAALAEALGRQNGIQVQAAAVSVNVPGGEHAVALVKTGAYGIVIVDWGQLTPTYTFNTRDALRIYQALQGVPEMYHEITDASQNGRHVGYLFTDEGKLMVKKLTYEAEFTRGKMNEMFDDDPRGEQVTVERYKNILKRAFEQ